MNQSGGCVKTKTSEFEKSLIFIGVAWPYVNGALHIGHLAGCILPSDIIARFFRLRGNNVLMVSGSDCYGTPISIEADKLGVHPGTIIEKFHPKAQQFLKKLNISFDLYTSTYTDNHSKIVQDFFVELLNKGYIFKDSSNQYYSAFENRFLPDRYVEGICPNCKTDGCKSDQCEACGHFLSEGELIDPKSKISGKTVELRASEHYFLDWSKLQPFLETYVNDKSNGWRHWVIAETNKWLKLGLKPRAITRDLDWGIDIPVDRINPDQLIANHQGKKIYVWFDAVIGYFSASVEWSEARKNLHHHTNEGAVSTPLSYKDFWYEKDAKHYYFMGKDNLVFHTLFWPGQLHLYDEKLHLPDYIPVNNYLNFEGLKFSKSKGLTLDPAELVDTYGLDPVRFYLCYIAPENSDSNFTYADLINTNNKLLAGKIGNFVNRTLSLCKTTPITSVDFKPANIFNSDVKQKIEEVLNQGSELLINTEIRKYAEHILNFSDYCNKFISDFEPWALRNEKSPKFDLNKFKEVINDAIFLIITLGVMLNPIIPDTIEKLSKMVGVSIDKFVYESEGITLILKDFCIDEITPLFKMIEDKAVK